MQPEDTPRAAPPVVVIYGPESDNEVLADELALDGYDVRLVSDRALRAPPPSSSEKTAEIGRCRTGRPRRGLACAHSAATGSPSKPCH
jgi:hypothetical protein